MNNHFEAIQDIKQENEKRQPQKVQTNTPSVFELLKKEIESKIQRYKEKIKELENELKSKELQIENLTQTKTKLEQELQHTKEQLENLEKEKQNLIEEKTNLENMIQELKEKTSKEEAYKNAVLKSLETISSHINQKKELALEELKTIISTILESIYAKCSVDLESIIKSVLEDAKIFREFIIIKANKTFIEHFKKYVKNIENLEIEFVEENFEEGEFQIETKDFILERFNRDLIENAVEKALQNIR